MKLITFFMLFISFNSFSATCPKLSGTYINCKHFNANRTVGAKSVFKKVEIKQVTTIFSTKFSVQSFRYDRSELYFRFEDVNETNVFHSTNPVEEVFENSDTLVKRFSSCEDGKLIVKDKLYKLNSSIEVNSKNVILSDLEDELLEYKDPLFYAERLHHIELENEKLIFNHEFKSEGEIFYEKIVCIKVNDKKA